MKNSRLLSSFIVLVLCLLLFAGANTAINVNVSDENNDSETVFLNDTEDESMDIFMVETGNVSEFSFTTSDNVSVKLYRDSDTWFLSDDSSLNLNQDVVEEILSSMCLINANLILKDVNVSDYGLDSPEINYELKIEDAFVLISLGDTDKDGNVYFLMNNDESFVYRGFSSIKRPTTYSLSDILMFE